MRAQEVAQIEDVAPPKILQNAETENQCNLIKKKYKAMNKTMAKK